MLMRQRRALHANVSPPVGFASGLFNLPSRPSPLFLVSPFSCPEATHVGQFAALLCRISVVLVRTTCELAKGKWLSTFSFVLRLLTCLFSATVVFGDACPHGSSALTDSHKPGFQISLIWRRRATAFVLCS